MNQTASLHTPPSAFSVYVAQLRLNARALRTEGLVFLVIWVLFAALVLRAALANPARTRFAYSAGLGFPLVAAALLIPFSIWRGEGPHRRGYHGAMPVDRRMHTLLKCVAGLALVLLAGFAHVALHLGTVGLVRAVGSGNTLPVVPAWHYVVTPSAAGAMYLFGSAIAVGLRHPWRWLMMLGPGAVMLPFVGRQAGWPWLEHLGTTLWSGPYGAATLAGVTNIADANGAERWLISLALWGSAGIGALLLASLRYADDV